MSHQAGERSAVQEAAHDLGLKVVSIICLDDLVHHLEANPAMSAQLAAVADYRARYGVQG